MSQAHTVISNFIKQRVKGISKPNTDHLTFSILYYIQYTILYYIYLTFSHFQGIAYCDAMLSSTKLLNKMEVFPICFTKQQNSYS